MMRVVIFLAILCIPLAAKSQDATVKIGGLDIGLGMLEGDVRYAFPRIKCRENALGADKSIVECYAGTDVPEENDGFVSFVDGRVHRATRHWNLPKESGPYEAFLLVNDILLRLAAEASTCAEIGRPTYVEQRPGITSTVIHFPEKTLLIHRQKDDDSSPGAFVIAEYLHQNPVPKSYEVRQDVGGDKRCALIE